MPTTSINLRPLTIDDYNIVLNWSKDDAFCSSNGWEKNRDPEELFRWWNNCIDVVTDDFIRMGIEMNKQLLGYVDLAYIKDNTAELGIAIGDSRLWGKGIGFNAALSMMGYGTKELGVTSFYAETHETNIRSKKMLGKLGFKEISRIGLEEYLGKNEQLIQYRYDI
ncbi:GNAT family N-acetyltransferase [Paenibacillus gallinarum]|uniref:GNAT family N-acetyltransferase n=1 Tax=Paenibacillus gallinarum TaxID=2762232 RepID=A0ABR8T0I9_9BACL|nr:GNAT family N-acetyltransferase [Paenibacillus gallinarum]MBD7969295.1 GNAT family N-acetyltransferase [Paenibacillus gallinarum]